MKSAAAFIVCLLVSGLGLALSYGHFDTFWVFVLGFVPLLAFPVGLSAPTSGDPLARTVGQGALNLAVATCTLAGVGLSQGWSWWLLLPAYVGLLIAMPLVGRLIPGRIRKASGALGNAAIKADQKGADGAAGLGHLNRIIEVLSEAGSVEILAEARLRKGRVLMKNGQLRNGSRAIEGAAEGFARAGRSKRASALVAARSSASVRPRFPWRDVLQPYVFYTAILVGLALPTWFHLASRGLWEAPLWAWGGVSLALMLSVPGLLVAGYGLMSLEGEPVWVKLVRIPALLGAAAVLSVSFGALFVGPEPELAEASDLLTTALAAPAMLIAAGAGLLSSLPTEGTAALSAGAVLTMVVSGFVAPFGVLRWRTKGLDLDDAQDSAIVSRDPITSAPSKPQKVTRAARKAANQIQEAADKAKGGDMPGALALLDEAEAAHAPRASPESKEAMAAIRCLKALLKIEQGDEAAALALVSQSLKAGISHPRLSYLEGWLHLRASGVDAALNVLAQINRRSGSLFDADRLLSIALLHKAYDALAQGKLQNARKAIDQIRGLGVVEVRLPRPLHQMALNNALQDLGVGDLASAQARFEEIVEAASGEEDQTSLLASIGVLLTRQLSGKAPSVDEIARVAEAALTKLDESPEPEKGGDLESMLRELVFRQLRQQRTGAVDRRCPRDLFLLASIGALESGQPIEAIEGFIEKALAVDGGFPEGHLVRGLVALYASKDEEVALEHLKVARQQGEISDPEIDRILKTLQESVTRQQNARASYYELMEAYMSNPEVSSTLKTTIQRQGDLKEDFEHFLGVSSPDFLTMSEREPSLGDFKQRVAHLTGERIPSIADNLQGADKVAIDKLCGDMKAKTEALEALVAELKGMEQELLERTGTAIKTGGGRRS